MPVDEQWARDHIGMVPAVGGCGKAYHDESGSVQDCTSVEPCRACLRQRIAQLEARTTEADPFARTWRDFTAGWAAARNVPTQNERETDYIERDAAAERWENALRHSKIITAKGDKP